MHRSCVKKCHDPQLIRDFLKYFLLRFDFTWFEILCINANYYHLPMEWHRYCFQSCLCVILLPAGYHYTGLHSRSPSWAAIDMSKLVQIRFHCTGFRPFLLLFCLFRLDYIYFCGFTNSSQRLLQLTRFKLLCYYCY